MIRHISRYIFIFALISITAFSAASEATIIEATAIEATAIEATVTEAPAIEAITTKAAAFGNAPGWGGIFIPVAGAPPALTSVPQGSGANAITTQEAWDRLHYHNPDLTPWRQEVIRAALSGAYIIPYGRHCNDWNCGMPNPYRRRPTSVCGIGGNYSAGWNGWSQTSGVGLVCTTFIHWAYNTAFGRDGTLPLSTWVISGGDPAWFRLPNRNSYPNANSWRYVIDDENNRTLVRKYSTYELLPGDVIVSTGHTALFLGVWDNKRYVIHTTTGAGNRSPGTVINTWSAANERLAQVNIFLP